MYITEITPSKPNGLSLNILPASYLLDNLLQNWSQCITKVSERKTNIAANSIEHSELYRIGELICYGAYLFKTFEIYDE